MEADRPVEGSASGNGKWIVVAAVVGFVAAAAGWTAWQLSKETPRPKMAMRQEPAFDATPAARPGPAPQALGSTVDGKPFSLADAKGQVVFVNFWATWCPPCRDEMPSMLKLGAELAARHPGKFRMVAVSVDDGWPEVLSFFGGKLPEGVTWLRDPDQSVTRAYYCEARGSCPESFKFPETYLVDPSGRLVSYVIGPRDWSEPGAKAFLEGLFR